MKERLSAIEKNWRTTFGNKFHADNTWYWKHILSVINTELNQTDRFQTEKDELIKIKNTLRKQLNQLQPNIKTYSKVKKSAKWLKSNKNKNKSHENVSTDK